MTTTMPYQELAQTPIKHWRLVLTPPASGASNMALDQALLESASDQGFVPTLRFYRWAPPALSLGRFQPVEEIDLEGCAAEGIEVVRRPTGGKGILHLEDFTYSLVIPDGWGLPRSVEAAYVVICAGIIAALRELGVEASLQSRADENYRLSGGACFAATTRADLVHAGRKLCGSAQVRRGGATLQHGSLFLSDGSETLFKLLRFRTRQERLVAQRRYRSRCVNLREAGCNVTWEEIGEAFRRGFEKAFAVRINEASLTAPEKERWRELEAAYRSPRWIANTEGLSFPSLSPRDKRWGGDREA